MHFSHLTLLSVCSNEKIYHFLKRMVEENIYNLFPSSYDAPQSDSKRQKLLECILTGNSKLYLGKVYTKEQINKLSDEEVDKLFSNYKAKLSGQMVKSLGKSIINMYSMGACAVLGISNQDALSEDLENNPFLNSALQRFTCELYFRFGSFLASFSVGLITSRPYLPEHSNKNGGTSGDNKSETEKPTTLSKYEGLGAAMAAELMVGFWFGIGVILPVKMVHSLEDCIEELIKQKIKWQKKIK